MPNLANARKALRQNKAHKAKNDAQRNHIKNLAKKIETTGKKGSIKDIEVLLKEYFKAVDKAAKKNIIHKNTAARKKSRIVKRTKKLK